LEWISAIDALTSLIKTAKMDAPSAGRTICARANDGLIQARARRLVEGSQAVDNVDVPPVFWWARGASALTQNWATGDFETWINSTTHIRAYGVKFAQSDIEELLPKPSEAIESTMHTFSASLATKGGRPPADWWEDLLIDLCFKHFHGDLKPKKQAEVQLAMQEWIANRGYSAADSTVRVRAQKLWNAICRDAEN
jgi:hypothetical protein